METSIPNIISSDIILSENDIFWDDEAVKDISSNNGITLLVVINEYEKDSIDDTVLGKLLTACKLKSDDYYILKIRAHQKIAWYQVRERLHPKVILSVGILPAQLGISSLFKLNEVNNYDNCKWIPALSVEQMEKQLEMKNQLWKNALKPVFINQ